MKHKPKPYQIEGPRMISGFKGRALLADEMGLGKTYQFLRYVALFYRKFSQRKIIIVCPAVAKFVWLNEAKEQFGLRSQILEGREPSRKQPFNPRADIYIINYDILPGWLPYLMDLDAGIIGLDEVHYIKGHETIRYDAVKTLCKSMPRIVGISGTPLTNRPTELWPFLNILIPEMFPSYYTFAMEYSFPKFERGRWKFEGAQNLSKLNKLLTQLCMVRRLKKDVLKGELQEKVRTVIPVPIKNPGEYKKASQDFMHWLRAVSPGKARAAERNIALVKVGYMLRLAARLKHKFVVEWIDNFLANSDKKLVVFTGHKKVINLLEKRYGDMCVKVDGSVNREKRKLAEYKFKHDPKCRVFLGNYRAAGVAITLTTASDLVCVDLPWTPGELVQAEDRVHRISQTQGVNIWYLIAHGTIEEAQCRVLQRKQSILAGVLDGDGKGDSLNTLTELLNTIKGTNK